MSLLTAVIYYRGGDCEMCRRDTTQEVSTLIVGARPVLRMTRKVGSLLEMWGDVKGRAMQRFNLDQERRDQVRESTCYFLQVLFLTGGGVKCVDATPPPGQNCGGKVRSLLTCI